jgi:hypothetical protein
MRSRVQLGTYHISSGPYLPWRLHAQSNQEQRRELSTIFWAVFASVCWSEHYTLAEPFHQGASVYMEGFHQVQDRMHPHEDVLLGL